jgi:hypothetical protein
MIEDPEDHTEAVPPGGCIALWLCLWPWWCHSGWRLRDFRCGPSCWSCRPGPMPSSNSGNRDEAALIPAREYRAPVLIQSTVDAEAGTNKCLPLVPPMSRSCAFMRIPAPFEARSDIVARLRRSVTGDPSSSSPHLTMPGAPTSGEALFPGQVYASTSRPCPLGHGRGKSHTIWGGTVKHCCSKTVDP